MIRRRAVAGAPLGKVVTFPIRGKSAANPLLADTVAADTVAMHAMRGRWISGNPSAHQLLGLRREGESEVFVDFAHRPKRLRMELPMIDVVELCGARLAHLRGEIDGALPIGTLSRPEHFGPGRVSLEHASRHVQGAAERR